MLDKTFVRLGLARSIARRCAIAQLSDEEFLAEVFEDEEITEAEKAEARAEMRRIAERLRSPHDD